MSNVKSQKLVPKLIRDQKQFSATPAYYKLFFFVIALILFTGCDDESPISNDTFQKIYVDLLIIQDTTMTSYSLDSMKTIVLNKYNVSPLQYDSMIEYYNSKPLEWIAFYDSVTAYVERLKLEAENQP